MIDREGQKRQISLYMHITLNLSDDESRILNYDPTVNLGYSLCHLLGA